MMKTDVKQTDNGYEVAVDLPGCKKDDVQMELNDGYLTIQAVRSHLAMMRRIRTATICAVRPSPAPAPAVSMWVKV